MHAYMKVWIVRNARVKQCGANIHAYAYMHTYKNTCIRDRTGGKGRGKETGNLEQRIAQKQERKRIRDGDAVEDGLAENIDSTKRMKLENHGHGGTNGYSNGHSNGMNGSHKKEEQPEMVVSDIALRMMQKQGYDKTEGIGR
jgi:hypothetical protein